MLMLCTGPSELRSSLVWSSRYRPCLSFLKHRDITSVENSGLRSYFRQKSVNLESTLGYNQFFASVLTQSARYRGLIDSLLFPRPTRGEISNEHDPTLTVDMDIFVALYLPYCMLELAILLYFAGILLYLVFGWVAPADSSTAQDIPIRNVCFSFFIMKKTDSEC